MKKSTKYLDMATRLLTEIYKDDVLIVANIVYAHADKDYETIYKQLKKDRKDIKIRKKQKSININKKKINND